MKPTHKPTQMPLERKGCWPFSLESFDRTPGLSKSEIAALSTWYSRWLQRHSTSIAPEAQCLHRLLVPLDAVLGAFGKDVKCQLIARAHLLTAMHKTQTSYWAWGEQEWLACVGVRYQDFPQRWAHGKTIRNYVLACTYLLGNAPIMRSVTEFQQYVFARKIFGTAALEHELAVVKAETKRLGFGESAPRHRMPVLLSEAFLISRSPSLKDLTLPVMEQLREKVRLIKSSRAMCTSLSRVLCNMQILPHAPALGVSRPRRYRIGVEDSVSDEWLAWVERWCAASTMPSRWILRRLLIKVGRWCGTTQNITNPAQWTSDTCNAFVAAVNEMKYGEWNHPKSKVPVSKIGKPLVAGAKANLISAVTTFFADCQFLKWITPFFNPKRCLAIPPSIYRLMERNPRVVVDVDWAKLVHAGLSLTGNDLGNAKAPGVFEEQMAQVPYYPFEMVRAIVVVWLFAGLRANEIKRLSTGCIRWEEQEELEGAGSKGENRICWLTVPINKTSPEFIKPVDPIVGHAIQAWEKMLPTGLPQWDAKSEKDVQFLFRWRGTQIGKRYLNRYVIPMLCRKAGVPVKDAKGPITCHRARATIASQLYNAPGGFDLYQVSKWLGHRTVRSTQSYVLISPTRLAESYFRAGYEKRNRRMMDVWVEQEAMRNKAPAAGNSRLLHDLGHGFCDYNFFDACEHRSMCTQCDFYQPKDPNYVQMMEAKANLLRLKQSITLSNEQLEAVDEGIAALEKITRSLQDVATTQCATPRE